MSLEIQVNVLQGAYCHVHSINEVTKFAHQTLSLSLLGYIRWVILSTSKTVSPNHTTVMKARPSWYGLTSPPVRADTRPLVVIAERRGDNRIITLDWEG